MKTKWLKLVILLLAVGLLGSASADVIWTGAGGDDLWVNAGNWAGDGLGNTIVNDQTNGSTVTVGSGDVATAIGDMFGPEWGMTLNVDGGSLTHTGFAFAPVGDVLNPSTINVSNGGYLEVGELLLGDNWWFFTAPGADLNVYDDTSSVVARGWCWLGGNMNIHDGTVDIAGELNMNANLQNNAHIDISDGQLIVRGADISANVATWIGTGELTAYGYTPGTHGAEILVDTTTIAGGTIITATVPEPATMVLLGFGALSLIRKRR